MELNLDFNVRVSGVGSVVRLKLPDCCPNCKKDNWVFAGETPEEFLGGKLVRVYNCGNCGHQERVK